ncbi:MAG: RecQ family ATP-dependent DNA helicase [Halanaerobiales bacterium]|nr:RecQ family ATP-dependent DNA helicase [Halanaerobiales bacterium]
MQKRAKELLRDMFGSEASFYKGQWEAIDSVLSGNRTLVVQRTGWGKSIVYFIATKLLRENGSGLTILISPLLSLMRNQIDAADRLGLNAVSINSTNEEEWDCIVEKLHQNDCDILLVSPERLSNPKFKNDVLPYIEKGIGMFVVDEAHCISDWGHDFRPDYRRIVRIVNNLPSNVPVLATTATANDRVVSDIEEQLGSNLVTLRGPLIRESLKLQTIKLADQSERLAWLSENLPNIEGTGIIYCLTVADCKRVAKWLRYKGIEAYEYYGGKDNREELEEKLMNNEIKVLVATVALGMGFDKPDLGFVIHYQRPGSLVAYYQQIGRAGRGLDSAYAILLNGKEDDDIQDYFISSAFPGVDEMREVLNVIESSDYGLKLSEMMQNLNLSPSRIKKCLKMLEIDGIITKDGSKYVRTSNRWYPDFEKSEEITALRRHELQRMQDFVELDSCLMRFISEELNDLHAEDCGRCTNCAGIKYFSDQVSQQEVIEAIKFLRGEFLTIKSRKRWPYGEVGTESGNISVDEQNQEGRILCRYGDAGWGCYVHDGKYINKYFSDDLVNAAVELILNWEFESVPTWVTCVPSNNHTELVPDFARRVAEQLKLPFIPCLVKVKENEAQKEMENGFQQSRNVIDVFEVEGEFLEEPVLLIDDMVDSRWTLTVCGMKLRRAGSGLVYPFVLASIAGGD